MACPTELATADACVAADAAACSCVPGNFTSAFPEEIGGAYRMTMAFEIPGTPAFCDRANDSVCAVVETSGSCCCQTEINDYISCMYVTDYNIAYNAGDCAYSMCGMGEKEGGAGGSMLYIIIGAAAGGAVLLLLAIFCYCRRKKRLAAALLEEEGSKGKQTKEDDSDDSDVETGKKKKKSKKGFESDSSDEESISKRKKKGSSRKGFSSDSDDSETRHSKRGKLKKRNSKKGFDSDSSDDDTRRGKTKKRGSKKGFDSDSSEDDTRRGKMKKRGSKKGFHSDSDDSYTGNKRRNSKRGFDDYSDSESDDSRDRRSVGQLKRRGSKRSMDGYSDDNSESRRDRGMKKRSSKRGIYDSGTDDESWKKPNVVTKYVTADESCRQARTILKTVKTAKNGDDAMPVEVQEVLNTEMSALIATLKAQKDEAERKLRESETEATKLRIEQEYDKQKIVALETKKLANDVHMTEVSVEAKRHQDAANEKDHSAMGAVQKEREEMEKMIRRLERAQKEMDEKLRKAQNENSELKQINQDANAKVSNMERDQQELKLKLAQLESTRKDIDLRLSAAEEESKLLKSEKKVKTKQIHEYKESIRESRSVPGLQLELSEMETERKRMSTELKRIAKEKEQMASMIIQLEQSRAHLHSLLEEDEQSIDIMADSNSYSNAPSSRYSNYGAGRGQEMLEVVHEPTQQVVRRISLSNLSAHGLDADDEYEYGGAPPPLRNEEERPAGWLGNTIANRNFNNLQDADMDDKEAYYVRPSQTAYQEPQTLRSKREKARRSERRLRGEMDRSRSSQRSLGSASGLSMGSAAGLDEW